MDLGGLHREVAVVLDTYGHRRLELEFRLGHRSVGGKFVPGLSKEGWERLKRALDIPSKALDRVVVTETTEFICDDNSGAVAKTVQRNGGAAPYWLHKKRLRDFDYEVTDSPWACRVSLSLEDTQPTQQPRPSAPTFERHKQRWSYRYGCWAVELTRVRSNLPHQLDSDMLAYEVEIELVDVAVLFTRPLDNVLKWGWSIAADMSRLAEAAAVEH
jgi:hypothetical protein